METQQYRSSSGAGEDGNLAHVAVADAGSWRTHVLADHLRAVGAMAGGFAASFGGDAWAYVAGIWHDLGKYRGAWQQYLRAASGYQMDAHIEGVAGRMDHSTAGAMYAEQTMGLAGRVLAYLIAGHHAGLPDYEPTDTGRAALRTRLHDGVAKGYLVETMQAAIPDDILHPPLPSGPLPVAPEGFHLWVRMLFSCLTDADFLDTEQFMDPFRSSLRMGADGNMAPQRHALRLSSGAGGDGNDQLREAYRDAAEAALPPPAEGTLAALLDHFNRYMTHMQATRPPTPVDPMRNVVLDACRAAASEPPGYYSLTVPTGGGKTLSSLAFALEHAVRHQKRRVIYVIPYTSIIEQTADVFREVFRHCEDGTVIEHHSQVEIAPEHETAASRIACENWDAPIVATTNVQFFESLFAARPSRCRKLHNIINSVVILDEAHMLPPGYLQPICDILNLLTREYGVTVVLCTATPPDLISRSQIGQVFRGLEGMREIIPDPGALYRQLTRVTVHLPRPPFPPTTWADLAAQLSQHAQVLCIVNGARRDARELWHRMPEGTYHLSAMMCGAHRADVLRAIREALALHQPVRVISTPVVECGVDLDFPAVYRALSGLDSLAQAAGRCNRHGTLPERGQVHVFVGPHPLPPGPMRLREAKAREVLRAPMELDTDEAEASRRYFQLLYGASPPDAQGIGALTQVDLTCGGLPFRTLATRMRLIDDDTCPIAVRYGAGAALIDELAAHGPDRGLLRRLQRYTVNVYDAELARLVAAGVVQEVGGYHVQAAPEGYHPVLGLRIERPAQGADGNERR